MAKNRGLGLKVIDYIRESSNKRQQGVLQQNKEASKKLEDLRKNRPKSIYKDDMNSGEIQESLNNINTNKFPAETEALRRRRDSSKVKGIPFQNLGTSPKELKNTFSQEGIIADYNMTSNLSGFTPSSNDREATTTNEPKEDLRSTKKEVTATKEMVKNTDPQVVEAVAETVNKEEAPEKRKGLSEDFKNALMRFGPQLGGMLIGGLMEGSEGAVAGGMMAAGNQQMAFDQEMAENKMDLQQQNADSQEEFARINREKFEAPQLSLAQGWTDSAGNPVTLDRKSGKFFNLAGEETSDVRQVQQSESMTPYQQAQIDLKRQELAQKGQGGSNKALEKFNVVSAGNLANKAPTFRSIEANIGTLDKVINDLESGKIGRDISPFESLSVLLGSRSQQAQDLVNKIVAGDIKETFGGNISDGERQFVVDVNFRKAGSPQANAEKLKKLKSVMEKTLHYNKQKINYLSQGGNLAEYEQYYAKKFPQFLSSESPLAKQFYGQDPVTRNTNIESAINNSYNKLFGGN